MKRKGFQEVPDTIIYEGWQMIVVVEGRWPHCWCCKELGHLVRDYPEKRVESTPKEPTGKPWEVSTPEPEDKQSGQSWWRKGIRNLPNSLKSPPLPPQINLQQRSLKVKRYRWRKQELLPRPQVKKKHPKTTGESMEEPMKVTCAGAQNSKRNKDSF